MRCAIIRCDTVPGLYVSAVGHDGDFALTKDKTKARTFIPATAVANMRRLANTALRFSVCPAAHVGPVAEPYVRKYLAKLGAL